MTTLFVKHHVKDFKQWKRSYDEFAPKRKEMGVTAAEVYRDANDPNTTTVTHQFKDLKAARAFANSKDLKSAMEKAGVNSTPEIWFAEDIERTPY